MRAQRRTGTQWLLLGLLFALLFAVESVAVYRLFTSRVPSGNDFYSRWAGGRALLVEGRDPYSLEVTAEIQVVKGIDPGLEGKGGFAYPLYVLFSFWPLVYLPYAWAQAIWMVALQWLVLAVVLVLVRLEGWRPSPLGLAGLFAGTLFLYPVARTILLGQFTLHVTVLLALSLLFLERRRDGWAGVCLAATAIKPQLVILIAPWLVIWTVLQRRWRFLGGMVAAGGLLLLGSLALFPRWPLSFLEDLGRYSAVAGGRNPLQVLLDLAWPSGPEAVRYLLAGLLLLAMLATWWQARRGEPATFRRAVHWCIVVSLLVPFQTGTTNQAMLLIPFFAWLRPALAPARVSSGRQGGRGGRWRRAAVVTAVAVLELGLWALFLATIKGDWENPALFLPLPLLSLVVLIAIEVSQWRAGRLPVSRPA